MLGTQRAFARRWYKVGFHYAADLVSYRFKVLLDQPKLIPVIGADGPDGDSLDGYFPTLAVKRMIHAMMQGYS